MKIYFTHLLVLLFTHITIQMFGQTTRSELAQSKIYIRATYFNKKNEYIGLQTRIDLLDTLIDNILYRKFQSIDFTDYYQKHETNTYYETFANNEFCLLDINKKVVHKINYFSNSEQFATIFGKQTNIQLEYIDTRNYFPKDTLLVTNKTPRKYFQKDNSEIYLVIIPDLQSLVVSSNGQFYTKQLMGDIYNDITDGFKNNFSASTKFDIQKGDEVQLFYRRKWYNDTTNFAEYQDKQFKNFKYISDTIINKSKAMKFEVEGYNYLSGNYEGPQEIIISLTDSGYFVGYEFVPYKTYKTELKFIDSEKGKELFLQGVTYDTIDGYTYPKIAFSKNDLYRYYILPFFPLPFIEFGNVQGVITYSKIKGVENGKKRERSFITDDNNIRAINRKKTNEVEVQIYFIEPADVEIEIKEFETDKIIAYLKTKAKKGINTFVIRSKNFKKEKEYRVDISYKNNSGIGSFSNSVKSVH